MCAVAYLQGLFKHLITQQKQFVQSNALLCCMLPWLVGDPQGECHLREGGSSTNTEFTYCHFLPLVWDKLGLK